MNKFLLIILSIILSINLTAEQEKYQPLAIVQAKADDANADKYQNEDCKSLSELPKFEQLVHKSLMSKFDLLDIHHNFILRQNTTLIKFMETLEKEKDEEGKIDKERLEEIVEQSHFPKVIEMRPFLEKMKDDLFIGYKIESLLDIMFKDDTKAVYNWFALLENEILVDIDNYEKADISLPQYRYELKMYESSKSFQIDVVQLIPRMSPKVFQN